MVSCGVCRTAEKRYCCPKCSILYCSLACYKVHKEATTTATGDCGSKEEDDRPEEGFILDPTAEEGVLPGGYKFTTADTVPVEKLQLLGGSEKLKELLRNQHLREFLATLDKSEEKGRLMRKAMREPLFLEFVDCCLEAIGEGEDRQPTDEQILQAVQDKIEEED